MATLSMRERMVLAAVTALSVTALCAIGLATYQFTAIQADVTRILERPQVDAHAQPMPQALDGESGYTLGGQDQWMSARSFKDWKWNIRYSSPARIRYADAQPIGVKMTTLRRNMVLTLGLVAAAATALLVLLTGRIVRSLHGTTASPSADPKVISASPMQMAEASRATAKKPSAQAGVLDQVLHETWDQRPGQADPSRKTACTRASQAPSPIQPDKGIRPEENELTGS